MPVRFHQNPFESEAGNACTLSQHSFSKVMPVHTCTLSQTLVLGANVGNWKPCDQCGIKKRSSSTRKITSHTKINMVRPFAYVHGERGSLFSYSQKEVHDTMLLDFFYNQKVHGSL